MLRLKVSLMALLAVIVLGAISVGSASAEWFMKGVLLSGTTPLATTAVVDENTKLLVPSLLDLTIECTGRTLDGEDPKIEDPDAGFASSLKFLSCNTIKPMTGCALESANQTVATLPILARAYLGVDEEDRILLSPEKDTTLAEINFDETNSCAFASIEPVKGSVIIGVPTGQLELLNQAIVSLGSTENNSLEIGRSTGNKAYLVGGKALLKLANDLKWSFK